MLQNAAAAAAEMAAGGLDTGVGGIGDGFGEGVPAVRLASAAGGR